MADSSHFADIMKTIAFYAVLFVGGILFEFIGGAPLVAEILFGILLGPNGFNFVPDAPVGSPSPFLLLSLPPISLLPPPPFSFYWVRDLFPFSLFSFFLSFFSFPARPFNSMGSLASCFCCWRQVSPWTLEC